MTSPPEPDALLAGRFELLAELGHGASGTVYRARLRAGLRGLQPGTEVAVKFIREDRLGDPEARETLLREGELGMRVQSPHVVAVHAVETLRVLGMETTYLVMEFVPGTNLRALPRPAADDVVRRIGAQAALGLAALHAAGVLHRDIKAENLVLTPAHDVKLVDLGLASLVAADRRYRTEGRGSGSADGLAGTIAYAAPELIRGRRATAASDLYALGVVLYELAAGCHPFADATDADRMLDAHLHRTPTIASRREPRVSAFLDRVLADLLAKDPARRFASARTLAAVLGEGEASEFWREHERRSPGLASRRRLARLRRQAAVAFLGHRRARRTLDGWLRRARRGDGRLIQIVGARGNGRRRLLDECLDRWLDREDDLLFLGGVTAQVDGARPGTPFGDLILDAFLDGDVEIDDGTAPRLAIRLVDHGVEAAEARGIAAAATGGGAPSARARAALLARGVLHATEGHRVAVIRVDHAERLGTVGHLALRELADQARSRRVLILAVTTAADPAMSGETLAVDGLGRDDFVRLGTALFRAGAVDPAALRRAHATLSGSPGALLDSLDDHRARGELTGGPGSYEPPVDGLELRPARPAIQRYRDQLALLPPAQRHLLAAAAVLGVRFRVDDVCAITGAPELEVLAALTGIDQRVAQVQRGIGTFRHRDFRRATELATPAAMGRWLHREAAWRLQERGARPLEVGLHLSRALEHRACLEPLLNGVESLIRQGSRRTAHRVIERLRRHLARIDDGEDVRALRRRWHQVAAALAYRAGDVERAQGDYRAAAVLALRAADPAATADALLGLAEIEVSRGHFLGAIQLATGAFDRVASSPTPAAAAMATRASLLHARALAYQGRASDAAKLLTRALAGDPAAGGLRADLLVDLARWEAQAGHLSAAGRRLDEAAEATELDPVLALRIALHRGRLLGWLGSSTHALRSLDEAIGAATRLEHTRLLGRALCFRAELAAFGGAVDDAMHWAAAADRAGRDAGDRLTADYSAAIVRCLGGTADVVDDSPPVVQVTARIADWLDDAERDRAVLDHACLLERRSQFALPARLTLLLAAGREARRDRVIGAIGSRLPAAQRRSFFAWANAAGAELLRRRSG